MGGVLWGLRKTRCPLRLGVMQQMWDGLQGHGRLCGPSVFGTTLGAPRCLGFPSLAPGNLGSEPHIPAGSSPLSTVT